VPCPPKSALLQEWNLWEYKAGVAKMKWWYAIDGRREGPVEELEVLKLVAEGRLKPADHVWNETMGQQWARVADVPSLLGAPASHPGAVPAASGRISCVSAVDPAWQHMVKVLFKPFNRSKWFLLGFSAWLATLGEGGGLFNSPFNQGLQDKINDPAQMIERAKTFWLQYAVVIVPAIIVIVVLGLAISIALLWVRSRGKFMFLYNVVNDRTEIAVLWRNYAKLGSSLFWWKLWFGLICMAIATLLLVFTVWRTVVPCVKAWAFVPSVLPAFFGFVLLWIVFGIVAGYISRFLEDFVTPVMFKFNVTASEAWSRFISLLKPHFWKFVVYGLFYLILAMASGTIVLLAILATCCIAGCLMIIPYVGAVVVLPVTVFFRAYSIKYLAQFGPEYRLEPEITDQP
jgi:hypothetical protein